MRGFDEKLRKQNQIFRRQMMATGLFQKMTGFYESCPELICRAVLSSGEYIEVCIEDVYTLMTVEWLYDPSICLSEFYWKSSNSAKRRALHWTDPDLASHQERIIKWCHDVVKGKHTWHRKDRYPGLATLHAVSFATAIKEAMLEDMSSTFVEPEEFQNHVLKRVRNGSKWTFGDRKFSCLSEDEAALTVSLVIINPADLGDLEEDASQFANHTVVYAPETPGRFFLYAIDDVGGERNCRTIVDGWLDDLEESEYVPG